jgi:hypothetical protein
VLTDSELKYLKEIAKPYKVSDRDGMYAYVTPAGSISFRYAYRINGRSETFVFGNYGREGSSPAQERQRAKQKLKQAESFEHFAEVWFQDGRMADSTRSMRRTIYDRDITPTFQRRLLHEIEPDDVRSLCLKVKDRGAPATAIHVRDIIKQIYAFANLNGEKLRDPAEEVMPSSLATFRPCDRSLSPKEIRVMLKMFEHVPTLPTIRFGMICCRSTKLFVPWFA